MEQMAGIVLHQQLQSEGVAEGARPTGPTALKPCEPPISTLFFDVFDTVDKTKQMLGAGRVDLDYIRNVIVKLLEVRALMPTSPAPATQAPARTSGIFFSAIYLGPRAGKKI